MKRVVRRVLVGVFTVSTLVGSFGLPVASASSTISLSKAEGLYNRIKSSTDKSYSKTGYKSEAAFTFNGNKGAGIVRRVDADGNDLYFIGGEFYQYFNASEKSITFELDSSLNMGLYSAIVNNFKDNNKFIKISVDDYAKIKDWSSDHIIASYFRASPIMIINQDVKDMLVKNNKFMYQSSGGNNVLTILIPGSKASIKIISDKQGNLKDFTRNYSDGSSYNFKVSKISGAVTFPAGLSFIDFNSVKDSSEIMEAYNEVASGKVLMQDLYKINSDMKAEIAGYSAPYKTSYYIKAAVEKFNGVEYVGTEGSAIEFKISKDGVEYPVCVEMKDDSYAIGYLQSGWNDEIFSVRGKGCSLLGYTVSVS